MLKRLTKALLSRMASNDYQTLNNILIYKDRLLNNVQVVKLANPGFSIIPVLKANAYGHGLNEIAGALNNATVSFIAVDGYFEAAKIKYTSKHKILVMGYIKPSNVRLLDTKKCSFVIQDVSSLKALGELKKNVNIHMELNTGMNRLGLAKNEIDEYLATLKKFPNLNLEEIMTHLADADNETSDEFTKRQTILFDKTVDQILDLGFKPKYFHIAQTAGSTKVKSAHANAIRLGIGLYGISPLGKNDPSFSKLEKLEPILEFKSTIIKCIDLNKGERVSYNGIFTATGRTRIGIIPLGYYEGLPRELSNRGFVTMSGKELKIVGRVCMNHTMIDITGSKLEVGSEVTVISPDKESSVSVENICKNFGLFSYTLVTGLSSSIRRRVV